MSAHRNPIIAFSVIAAAHLLATAVCLVFSIGETMARFDAHPGSVAGSVASFLLPILTAPLLPLVEVGPFRFHGMLGYLPFIANSTLWSIAIVWGMGRFLNKRAEQSLEPTATAVTPPAAQEPRQP